MNTTITLRVLAVILIACAVTGSVLKPVPHVAVLDFLFAASGLFFLYITRRRRP